MWNLLYYSFSPHRSKTKSWPLKKVSLQAYLLLDLTFCHQIFQFGEEPSSDFIFIRSDIRHIYFEASKQLAV